MKITSQKVSDTEISVTKTTEPVEQTTKYTKDYLLSQRVAIQAQLDQQTAARQAELDEIDALLAECETAGIITQAEANEAQIAIDKEVKPAEELIKP